VRQTVIKFHVPIPGYKIATYDVLVKKRTIQDIEKLPAAIQKKPAMLIDDLSFIVEVYYAGSRENAPY